MKDLEKRRRVMQRSMQLEHCICDPRKPCPCDVFRNEDLCPCAGEERAPPARPVRLTELVESPGCASKIDQGTLLRALAGLPAPDDPRVLVGMPAGDDAGVYQLDEKTALVQTVDVFTPSVDDPYVFGQIAAANSLSDVYAMGGRPITALSVIGFPARKLPDQIFRDILRGGLDKMAEAGTAVIGGHSINDGEIKAGFAVTGLIDPRRVSTNDRAAPGDRLVLTKPLGTGIVAFAARIGRADEEIVAAAARWMAALNKRAAELMAEYGAHACTDVTGFGLMGHLKSMAAASKVDVEIVWDDLPLLPGVLELAAAGVLPGAVERNRESSGDALAAAEGIDPSGVDILFDAQTSGGLLIALPDEKADAFVERLRAEGATEAAAIGRVLAAGTGRIIVRGEGRRRMPQAPCSPLKKSVSGGLGATAGLSSSEIPRISLRTAGQASSGTLLEQAANVTRQSPPPAPKEAAAPSCCANPAEHPELQELLKGPAGGDASGVKEIERKFQAFLAAANRPGRLDARTKRAMGIALSVLAKCGPCVKYHVVKAREEGFSPEEIDEAAWLGIAFGGSPMMMFYQDIRTKL